MRLLSLAVAHGEFNASAFAAQSARAQIADAALSVLLDLSVGTANVSTLYPKELLRSSTKQGVSMTSRALILEELFAQRSLDIVFVQEGRLQDDAVHPAQHYKMFRAGATSSGHHGSQIWLAHKLTVYVVVTRVISPRIIAIYLRIADLEVMLVSAHAPIEASDEHVKNEFWVHLQGVIMTYRFKRQGWISDWWQCWTCRARC